MADKFEKEEGGVKELWRLAYPLILSTASYSVMMFVNRIFLSWHSAEAIAAAVPAGILNFTIVCFFLGLTSYTNVFIAQFYGGRRYARLTVALWQGVWIAFISSFLIVCTVPLGRWIISASGHAPEVKILELQYYTLLAVFGGFSAINGALSSFFTGQGKTAVTMFVNIAGNAVNVVLSYLLIFGAGAFPEMGIRGAAIAFIISNAVMTAAYGCLVFSPKNRKVFRTGRLLGFHRPLFSKIIKYGAPNGVSFFLDMASFTVFIFLVGNTDKYILAANNIALAIDSLAFMPLIGVGMAVQTLTGQYIGRGKKETAFTIVRSALKLAVPYTLALSFLFFFAPGLLLKLFGQADSPDMSAIALHAYPLMKVIAVFVFFDMLNFTYSDAIRGAGDTKFQMLMASLCAWGLFVPGVYVILNVLHAPFIYTWVWGIFYTFTLASIFIIRFQSGKWQKINITE